MSPVAYETLTTYPLEFKVDADALARCIETCFACSQACTACADDCLNEEGAAHHLKCIRLSQDCADLCIATGRILSRQTTEYDAGVTARALDACAQACATCADESDRHADEHCAVCAQSCRRCEEACREMLAVLP
jgi:hypothetical protein